MKTEKKEKNKKKWKIFRMICRNPNCRKPPFEYRVHDAHHIKRLYCDSGDCYLWFLRLSDDERARYDQELKKFKEKRMPLAKRRREIIARRKKSEKPYRLESGKIYRVDGKEKIFHGEVVEIKGKDKDPELIWARKDIFGSLVSYNKNMVEGAS